MSFNTVFSSPHLWSCPLPAPACPLPAPGVGVKGQCYSTWSCDDFPGVQNSSLMPLEQCCGTLWGLSWRNTSDQTCLSCSYTLLPGQYCSYTLQYEAKHSNRS